MGNSPTNGLDPLGLWDFWKWLWTGDGDAKDEILQAALEQAGKATLDNAKNIEGVVEWTGEIDPTCASALIKSGVLYIQNREIEIPGEVVAYVRNKATGKIVGTVIKRLPIKWRLGDHKTAEKLRRQM